MLALEVAMLSEMGGRKANEDACGHWHSVDELCCVLADGAGGHGGGGIAARLVVERMLQGFAAHPTTGSRQLTDLVFDTNRAVIDARVPDTERANMFSTVVGLVIDFVGHRVHWAHAGDSRLYWFRQGRLHTRTRDHSLVQSLVDAGLLPPDQARHHPQRSELRSALGTASDVLEVSDSGEPRVVEAGDVFLLCTDGLWEHVPDAVLESTLADSPSPSAWLAALEREITAATRQKTSHDNFTALTVWTAPVPA
ncbi:PP2C family serine/threonine-protein phosphatase [Aquincola sp. MAHUQ-54]|uniref:PP2C family serine/threonine-protein phosphatase n=1 Tax=Aquincola agrisoli TaxID=3119538 RepID=A0AAW9QA60_9BURK